MNELTRNGSVSAHASTGAAMGVIAGVIFAVFAMIVYAAIGHGFFTPLREISAILLGEQALSPAATGLGAVILAGLLVHVVLSAIYGAIFGVIITRVSHSASSLALWGTAFGFVLWLANFFVFAPALFPWFTEANQWVHFIGHTFFFGTPLGVLMRAAVTARASQRQTVQP